MKINPPVNPLIGDMPKIGIRPTIDGRLGGVRESLEEQTMTMARNVAQFLSDNLRHYNGLPVECVIADSTIGGVAEAAACAEKFRREGVGVSLSDVCKIHVGVHGSSSRCQESRITSAPEGPSSVNVTASPRVMTRPPGPPKCGVPTRRTTRPAP